LASKEAKTALEELSVKKEMTRELLCEVARTSLRTKLEDEIADKLTECIVDAVLAVRQPNQPINLHMVEIMEMQHRSAIDTQLIKGLVLDHGARHPDMPKRNENCYILTSNVSLEYEKTEVNSGFYYKSAEEREKLVKAERAFTDARVQKIIDFKKSVCKDSGDGFILINQKGVDPVSLDALAREGIVALRRAKRRNMERLALACGGHCQNSVDDLTPDCLGRAGLVYETVLGESKFTFVEKCDNPQSVTLLIRGPNRHTISQIKDAVRDGLRSVKNAIEDGKLVPGAGAFEVAVQQRIEEFSKTVKGRQALGVRAFADALLIIPKTLAQNAGLDPMEAIVNLQTETRLNGQPCGVDLKTGEGLIPGDSGIWDNLCVKKQILDSATVISEHFLLIDEIMRAGLATLKGQ
jgi:T-complex protein 1 subunit zeta